MPRVRSISVSYFRARGALPEAEAAYRRADERGDPAAAFNLGVLLEERGALPLPGTPTVMRNAAARTTS